MRLSSLMRIKMLLTLNASRPIHLAGRGAELLDHLVGLRED